MRLQEGFHFAHNDSGILNLILELSMRNENQYKFSSVVQYIIFPPHVINGSKERYENISNELLLISTTLTIPSFYDE